MSASTAGALKALIEGASLSLSAYRDQAPKSAGYPYVVIHEELASVPDPLEDGVIAIEREMVQVDLWQRWRNPDRTINESYTLPRSLKVLLGGAGLPTAPTRAYEVRVIDSQRLLEPDVEVLDPTDASTILGYGLVHHAITVRVTRKVT